jgi:hypothetical protein
MRYVFEGTYWKAENNVYIDTQDDEYGYSVVCLNGFIGKHIKVGSKVTVVIDVEKEIK